MNNDLVKRLRQSWDVDRSIMSQTGQWMTEREEAADRIEALEDRVAAADKLAGALRNTQLYLGDHAIPNALEAYQATKENTNG